MKTLLSLFSLLMFSASLMASPVASMHKLGAGEMSFMFWSLYKAELYSANSQPSTTAAEVASILTSPQDKALRIEYLRQIDKQDLLDATQEQWQHLGYRSGDIVRWLGPLDNFWPSVTEGDVLTCLVTASGVSHFYFDDKPIGTIEDPEFGVAFLSIWLSPQTSQPALRARLLGLSN